MLLHPDVVELRRFYSSTLGLCVRRDVGSAVLRHWHSIKGKHLVGLGFAQPYLRCYLEEAASVAAVMFPRIGAMYWPTDISNHTILAKEAELALKDNSTEYVLVAHAAEHSMHLNTMMQEIFRILTPGGRVLFIVPNRRGLWSSRTNNPLGYGHPYHIAQLRHRGELAGMTYIRSSTALFYPPTEWRGILRISPTLERAGRLAAPLQGGALLVEMEKQLYAAITESSTPPLIAPALYPAANGSSARNYPD